MRLRFFHSSSLFLLCLLSSCLSTNKSLSTVVTEKPDYTGQLELRYEDKVYANYISTAQLYPSGNPLELPILSLGLAQTLELHFEDMSAETKNYTYRFIHCNADWTKSNLIEMQYLEGYLSDYINDYQTSFNTLVPFIHYSLIFPRSGMNLLLSGNYLLVVSINDDMEHPVLSKRFMVAENKVFIEPRVRQSSTIDDRKSSQSVDFVVNHPAFQIDNALRDLKTMVLQNGRWDNMKYGLRPTFIREQTLEYRYEQGEDFLAGNEFRKFNISSVRYANEDVSTIYRDSSHYTAILMPDLPRDRTGYRTFRDINGRFLVRNTDGFNNITESDYIDVTFTLRRNSPYATDVYVIGGFTGYRLEGKFKMGYDQNTQTYSLTLPIKQGYYEYMFALKSRSDGSADVTQIEGSYFETENEYTILMYYRDIGLDYDQLIGVKTISTRDFF